MNTAFLWFNDAAAMRPKIAGLFLLLLILSDELLKIYLPGWWRMPAILLLLIACVYFFLYFRRVDVLPDAQEEAAGRERRRQWGWLLVAAILLLGILLRFWKLTSLFDGFFWDESYKGLDAMAIRRLGERPIFLSWNAGREALVAYLVALLSVPFGYTAFAVRAVEALAGSLTLLLFYLLARRLFNDKIALVALFLMAVSKYHMIYSRFGIRVNLLLLFEVGVLYFLIRGLKADEPRRSWPWLLIGGLLAGLGFYTYIPYRVFPLVPLALLADPDIRARLRARLLPAAAGLLLCVLIVAPLAVYFVRNAQSFSDRMSRTSLWAKADAPMPVLLLRSARDTFGQFTYKGDMNPRHNVPLEPALSPFVTPLFWLGIACAAANIRRRSWAVLLFAYLAVTLLPGVLGAAAPHFSRNLGSLAPALLFCSLGAFAAATAILRPMLLPPAASRIFLAVVLAGSLLTGVNDGLFRYSEVLDSQDARDTALWGMNRVATDVATFCNVLPETREVYLSPQLFFHATVELLSRNPHHLFTPGTVFPANRMSVVVLVESPRNLWWLRDDDGKMFFKWWSQYYGMPVASIRQMVLQAYVSYPRMTNQSDRRLLNILRGRRPDARVIELGGFTVCLIPPAAAGRPPVQPH